MFLFGTPAQMWRRFKRRAKLEAEIAIALGECQRCHGPLPKDNTTTNPKTGRKRKSSLCPKCRKVMVKEFMARIRKPAAKPKKKKH